MYGIAPPRAGRREWIGLAVLALACVLYAMDLTVLHLAVPSLSEDLKPTSAQLLWIVDIYGFLVAGSLITMGTLGDRIGRRRLLLIGAAAFGAASVLAAFSTSAGMLIASRALMGVAGATLAPSTLSLIFNMFRDPGQRSTAIGVWITSFSAGGAIGPRARRRAAGVLLVGLGVPAGAAGDGAAARARPAAAPGVPRSAGGAAGPAQRRDVARGRAGRDLRAQADRPGRLWPAAGCRHPGGAGHRHPVRAAPARLADPLIDLRLFRIPTFSVSLATNMLAIFVAVGYFLFVAQYLQLVLGLSPLQAGLWSLPSSVGFIVGSNLAPRFVHRVRPALVLGAGAGAGGAGLALLTQVGGRPAWRSSWLHRS